MKPKSKQFKLWVKKGITAKECMKLLTFLEMLDKELIMIPYIRYN